MLIYIRKINKIRLIHPYSEISRKIFYILTYFKNKKLNFKYWKLMVLPVQFTAKQIGKYMVLLVKNRKSVQFTAKKCFKNAVIQLTLSDYKTFQIFSVYMVSKLF